MQFNQILQLIIQYIKLMPDELFEHKYLLILVNVV